MMGILLVMMGYTYSVPADSVKVIKISSAASDVHVYVTESQDSLLIRSIETFSTNLDNGVLMVSDFSQSINVTIPPIPEIHIQTVSGNVELRFDKGNVARPDVIELVSVSGDMEVTNLPPSNLKINTISGDVNIDGYILPDSSIWSSVQDTIITTSGDIDMSICVPAQFYIKTYSGDLEIDDADSLCKMLGRYKFESLSGDAYIDSSVMENFAEFQSSSSISPSSESESEEEGELPSFLSLWRYNSAIHYNRVQGLVIGISSSIDREQSNVIIGKDEFSFGARYAFSLKKWDFWLGVKKSIIPPLYIGAEAHSKVTTPDLWKMQRWENSLLSFCMNTDVFDYYFSKGVSGGLGLEARPYGDIFIGYEFEQMTSLEKRTDWSLFYPHKPFRENPNVAVEGAYKWLTISFSSIPGPIQINARLKRAIETPDSTEMMSLIAQIRGNLDSDFGVLNFRLTAGQSNTDRFPMGFRLGGIGTLPGYELNSIVTDRFGLMQVEYRVLFDEDFDATGVIFADAAKTMDREGEVYADVGVGAQLGPFTLLAAHPIDREKPFRLVFRLGKRL